SESRTASPAPPAKRPMASSSWHPPARARRSMPVRRGSDVTVDVHNGDRGAVRSRGGAENGTTRRNSTNPMTRPSACDLLTIGHSNLTADCFVALLKDAGVTAVADVRSVPFSRWCPWFSGKALAARLAGEAIAYIAVRRALRGPRGGRRRDPGLSREGGADGGAMAAPGAFAAGLERVGGEPARHRVCLFCAEREPLDCHRCLLVGRALAERGLALGHIRPDG